jgi:hypothetical protein
MRCRKETGLENPGEFFYPSTAKKKDCTAKVEALVLETKNDMKKMSKTYIELIIERAEKIDPSMDFLSTSKKIAMQKFYSKSPSAIRIKEEV